MMNKKLWKLSGFLCCTGLGIVPMAYRYVVITKFNKAMKEAVTETVNEVIKEVTEPIVETTGRTVDE